MLIGERLGPVETDIEIVGGIDSNNHLNNAQWAMHLETGQTETSNAFGIDMKMPLQQISIKYRAQILRGDRIKISTFFTKGIDFVDFDQEILREDKIVGKGSSRYGKTPLEIGQPLQNPISELPLVLEKPLHLASVLHFFEHARAEILSARGIDMKKEREERGIRYVVASLEAKYAGAIFPGERVLVRTGFKVYPPQLIFWQEIARENGQVVIKADTHCALVDRDNNLITSAQIINPLKAKSSSPVHSGP